MHGRRALTWLAMASMLSQPLLAAKEAASPLLVTPGYVPTEKDERGLWMQSEEAEREMKKSTFVIRDEKLNAYVRQVFCRTVTQEACKDVRIYLTRTAAFNAGMYPNGMMVVWSGLFLRTRNEAQLAAILGHEYTHYRNRHSVLGFKNAKKNFALGAWLGAIVGILGSLAAIGSYFTYSRELEAEADSGSIPLLTKAGYSPHAASSVWEQLRAEMDATALARNKKSRKDKTGGMFATHPPSAERMTALKAQADAHASVDSDFLGRAEFKDALAPFWAHFVDDQIKLNDFGGTEFLLESLAKEGWTSDLLYARGELYRARGRPEDLTKAAEFYQQAIKTGSAPVEAWRGLGLALVRGGKAGEGQPALKEYLKQKPDASDRAMVAMLAGGQE